jgi:serine/threonine protein kinase
MGGLFETSNIQGELKNIYTKQDVLDYNVYGVTHRCKENKTGNKVAIKIINKKYLKKKKLKKNNFIYYE